MLYIFLKNTKHHKNKTKKITKKHNNRKQKEVTDRVSSVQGYNSIDGNGPEFSKSISTSTVFMGGTREYGELYPHWTNDYIIDRQRSLSIESTDNSLNSTRLKHHGAKSAKLLQSFRIHCATWDSNGSTLYIDDYGKWLPAGGDDRRATTFQQGANEDIDKSLPELVAVTTQHLKLAEGAWEQRIRQHIGSQHYHKGASHHLRDHHFVLYIRRDMKHLLTNVQIASTGTTFRQFYGNKGGLTVGINFAGLKIGFVGIDLLNSNEHKMNDLCKEIQGIAHGLWLERPEIDFNHEFNLLVCHFHLLEWRKKESQYYFVVFLCCAYCYFVLSLSYSFGWVISILVLKMEKKYWMI